MSLEKRNKVLLVCYYFPPIGGTGIIRNLKYCKYLPRFGWDATVLTVKDVSYYIYDEAALNELPATCRVERSGSLDPLRISYLFRRMTSAVKREGVAQKQSVNAGAIRESSWLVSLYRNMRNWFFFPDGQSGWIPFAVWRGYRAVRKERIDVVMGSAHPISSVVIAALIAKFADRPLVLDFRDGWVGDPLIKMPSMLHKYLHSQLERWVLTSANAVLCYGVPFKTQYAQRYPELTEKIHIVPNGFDPEDFQSQEVLEGTRTTKQMHRLVWTGALTREIQRDAFLNFIKGCRSLPKELVVNLDVTIVGREYAGAIEDVLDICPDLSVNFIGQVSHQEANRRLAQADAALMLLPAGNLTFISNKVYEYLGAGLPILAVVEPEGVCASILRETGRGDYIAAPGNVASITDALKRLIGDDFPRPSPEAAKKYSRIHAAEQLAEHLHAAKAGRRNKRPTELTRDAGEIR